jgi:ATP-dependent Clp protease adaptor protein ClpS
MIRKGIYATFPYVNTGVLSNREDEEAVLEEVLTDLGSFAIVLYNDDFNTFEWVIQCLVKYCKHTSEQAEQCAWIVHNTGKCQVLSGGISYLTPICEALRDAGLSVVIEELP